MTFKDEERVEGSIVVEPRLISLCEELRDGLELTGIEEDSDGLNDELPLVTDDAIEEAIEEATDELMGVEDGAADAEVVGAAVSEDVVGTGAADEEVGVNEVVGAVDGGVLGVGESVVVDTLGVAEGESTIEVGELEGDCVTGVEEGDCVLESEPEVSDDEDTELSLDVESLLTAESTGVAPESPALEILPEFCRGSTRRPSFGRNSMVAAAVSRLVTTSEYTTARACDSIVEMAVWQ